MLLWGFYPGKGDRNKEINKYLHTRQQSVLWEWIKPGKKRSVINGGVISDSGQGRPLWQGDIWPDTRQKEIGHAGWGGSAEEYSSQRGWI